MSQNRKQAERVEHKKLPEKVSDPQRLDIYLDELSKDLCDRGSVGADIQRINDKCRQRASGQFALHNLPSSIPAAPGRLLILLKKKKSKIQLLTFMPELGPFLKHGRIFCTRQTVCTLFRGTAISFTDIVYNTWQKCRPAFHEVKHMYFLLVEQTLGILTERFLNAGV